MFEEDFIEGYELLEKNLKGRFGTESDLDEYIGRMESERGAFRIAAGWDDSLKQLKRLYEIGQRIREYGSDPSCTKEDADLVRDFAKCLLNDEDPLSVLEQLKARGETGEDVVEVSDWDRSKKKSLSRKMMLLMFIIITIACLIIAASALFIILAGS